jgi:pyruvate kinase
MKKTKIICTMGPACENEETLEKMMLAGMNVARFNFSHGDHADHKRRMDMVKRVREKLGLPIAILLDTKGPEYRIGTFENHKIELADGDSFVFTTEECVGDEKHVSVSYKHLPSELSVGDTILLNNGLLEFSVENTTETEIFTKVIIGGELSDRKSMSFPGKMLHQEYLSEKDREDILFGIENDVDFICNSDAHSVDRIGEISKPLSIVERMHIPSERIANLDKLPRFRSRIKKGLYD